jgi:hypothetical protein
MKNVLNSLAGLCFGDISYFTIIIIIISCYPLWDTGCQQNVAILSSLWPSCSPRSSCSLSLPLSHKVLKFHILFMPKVVQLESVWFPFVDVSLIIQFKVCRFINYLIYYKNRVIKISYIYPPLKQFTSNLCIDLCKFNVRKIAPLKTKYFSKQVKLNHYQKL